MQFPENEVFQITATIWASMLGLKLKPNERMLNLLSKEHPLISCIHITGDWNGTVVLHCSFMLARQITAIMFDVDIENITMDQIQDVLGELVNIIGGNVKSLLPLSCCLSLPVVVEDTDFTLKIPSTNIITRLGFECQGQSLMVMVLQNVSPTINPD